MEKLKLIVAIASAIYLLSNSTATAHAQKLRAELCSAKLPTGRAFMAPLYDGDDTIYLFGGGNNDDAPQNTLKYSISKDTIEFAGHFPSASFGGAAVMNKFGNIFLYYGRGLKPIIHQYFPASQTFANVSRFEDYAVGYTTVRQDMDTALIFGGDNHLFVTSLNLNTLESERAGDYGPGKGLAPFDAIWVEEKDVVYLFTSDDILKYYWTQNRFEILGKGVPLLSKNAIWDGHYVYLFGAIWGRNSTDIVLFDPKDEEIGFIQVENKPPLVNAAVIYVEKLNRIYLFGGTEHDESYVGVDTIYYISLDPMHETPTTTESTPPISTMDPDIFNCMGRPDAVYPYPGDCAKFVICRENHGYPYDCPEPLLFHPINRQCTWPDWVDCDEVPQI